MTSSERPQLPDTHRFHDRLLIARAVGEDLDPLDRAAADALLEACPDCRVLAAELRALRFAASDLPAVRRPRDFRLTQAQADRLRGGALQRFLAPLGGPAFGFLQPLAGAAIAIGLGLLVVTSVPLGLGGSAASRPEAQSAGGGGAAGAAGSLAPSRAPLAAQPTTAAGRSPATDTYGTAATPAPPQASPIPDKSTGEPGSLAPLGGGRTSGEQSQPTPSRDLYQPEATNWPIVGLLLALTGFALFLARGYARRHVEDPLLR
jgi:hypothetical protein